MKTWKDLVFMKGRPYAWINALYHSPPALPPSELLYKALDLTPFNEVKVVILGQDPYHTKGLANGLAFSVQPSVTKLPPSLRNIFKEYVADLRYPQPRNGDLTLWARRGVLLLNTILTVAEGKPLSHQHIGWQKLSIEITQKLSAHRERIVFVLWGNNAGEYKGLIDAEKHLVLSAPHPSPLSAGRGFFGSRPFTRANEYLTEPVDWRLE